MQGQRSKDSHIWEHIALGSAFFWIMATISVFWLGLENSVWVLLIYSAYANVGTDLARWQAGRAEREARS
jgi:hypothetical protein